MENVFEQHLCETTDKPTRIAMDAMVENYPDKALSKVVTFVNARFDDPMNVPSGVITIHPMDANVHRDSITPEMFTYTTVCAVNDRNGVLNNEYFKQKKELMNESIEQNSENPARIEGVETNSGYVDREPWSAELGENGYAGIYKQQTDDDKYFVVVQSCASKVYEDYKRKIVNNEMTFKDVLADNSFICGLNLAKRNCERLAYNVATSLGVEIHTTPDSCAKVDEEYIAKPFKSVAHDGMTKPLTKIGDIILDGERQAAIYNMVTPTQEVQKKHYVIEGPMHGITVFNMNNDTNGIGLPMTTKIGMHQNKKTEKYVYEGAMNIKEKTRQHVKINNDFLEAMEMSGWKQKGVNNRYRLTPVVVKLGNKNK